MFFRLKFFFKCFFRPKHFFWPKFFFKVSLTQNFFQEFFWTQIYFGQKVFRLTISWTQNCLWTQNFFEPTFFLTQFFFYRIFVWDSEYFRLKSCIGLFQAMKNITLNLIPQNLTSKSKVFYLVLLHHIHEAGITQETKKCTKIFGWIKNWQAELSWGSVQAETVRLQRQIDPGWMDNHLKFTEFCCLFLILGQKNVGTKTFWAKKILGPKNVGFKKFWSRKMLSQKKLSVKKMLGPKTICFQEYFVSKKRSKKILGPTKFWLEKL